MQDDQRRLPLLCKHGRSVKRAVTAGTKIRRLENFLAGSLIRLGAFTPHAFSLEQKIVRSAKEETELGVVIRRSDGGIVGLGWSAGWLRELAPAQYALIGALFTAAYLGLEWLTRVHELEALGITLGIR